MALTLSPLQARVVGVLMEKEVTTPEQYPLSLNGLTLGCNQKSNREPIMNVSEMDVQTALDELAEMRLLFVEQGSRVPKYKHRFCNTEFSSLKFSAQEFAIICVLLLRGAQTPGELRSRTNRLASITSVSEVESVLEKLANFNAEKLVIRLPREPGKRESRYMHTFYGDDTDFFEVSAQLSETSPLAADTLEQVLSRIAILESEVAELKKLIHR